MTVRIVLTRAWAWAWTTDCSTWHVITAIKVLAAIFIGLVLLVTPTSLGEIARKTVDSTETLLMVETIVRWVLVVTRALAPSSSGVETRWRWKVLLSRRWTRREEASLLSSWPRPLAVEQKVCRMLIRVERMLMLLVLD